MSLFKKCIVFSFLSSLSFFSVSYIHLGIWTSMELVYLNKGHSLKRNRFSSSNSNQLSVAPQLRRGFCAHLPIPCWDFTLLEYAQVLLMLSQPLWVHMCSFSILPGKCCFLVLIHCLWLLPCFSLLFSNDPCVLGGWDGIQNAQFRAENSAVSRSLHIN